MFRIAIVFLMVLSLEASDIVWMKSYAEAVKTAQSDKKPLLVYMHDDCGACTYLEKRVFSNADISEFIGKHFIAVRLEPKNDAPKTLQVDVAPVFHYVNYDGTEIQDDLIGAKPASSFLADLKMAVTAKK